MVEQEHSKSSTVFPEPLISNTNSLKYSHTWFVNDAASYLKSEEFPSSDFLNIELLPASILTPDETFTSVVSCDIKEKDMENILFQETMANDMFSTDDLSPYGLYYNDRNLSCTEDSWHPVSEKKSCFPDSFSEANSPISFWGNYPFDLETVKIDDVFQVDKDDLVQSPTLAELNANDESLFDSFDTFENSHSLEQKMVKSSLLSTCSSNNVFKIPSSSDLTLLKMKTEISEEKTDKSLQSDSSNNNDIVQIDMNSETVVNIDFNLDENKNSLNTEAVSKQLHKTNAVTAQVFEKPAKKSPYFMVDEHKIQFKSVSEAQISSPYESEEDDSEMDCDYSSDVDEDSEEETKVHSSKQSSSKTLLLQKKKSRYFWQYNIQSKGPKAPKLKIDDKYGISDDFSAISDPVFTSSCIVKGIKHVGKARRGDGNDLTPNPHKLYNIGIELEKLTSIIEGLIPANELPVNARTKSRKEKNKLASRACRLKKKAQHEANKLKLYGLQKEQKQLMDVLSEAKKIIRKSIENMKHGKVHSVRSKIEALCFKEGVPQVAGCSAEFVNNVLKKVDMGDRTGGLDMESLED